MYEVTSNPFDNLTLATFRNAELGFLGVVVYTLVHIPRRWGQAMSAGDLVRRFFGRRLDLTNWLKVGNLNTPWTEQKM